jgi:hypothetical protein
VKGEPTEVRFWTKVLRGGPDDCWPWTGALLPDRYGHFHVTGTRFDGVKVLAHRYAYQWERGPIPEGMMLDHLCNFRPCCNPWHLEVVTNAENVRRGYERRRTLRGT